MMEIRCVLVPCSPACYGCIPAASLTAQRKKSLPTSAPHMRGLQWLLVCKKEQSRFCMPSQTSPADVSPVQVVAHEFDSSTENNLIYSRNGVNITSNPVQHYNTSGMCCVCCLPAETGSLAVLIGSSVLGSAVVQLLRSAVLFIVGSPVNGSMVVGLLVCSAAACCFARTLCQNISLALEHKHSCPWCRRCCAAWSLVPLASC